MGKRTNTAVWMAKQNRWQIKVQKDGERKTFTSSKPGRVGQREANAKADAWLDEGVVTGAKVSKLWEDYLAVVKMTSGTSNYNNIYWIGDSYILPMIGNLKVDAVTEGKLQEIINKAYKTGSLKKQTKNPKGGGTRLKQGECLSRKTLCSIRTVIVAFWRYCRVERKATSLLPESLRIPDGARYKGKNILQPDALRKLYTVTTSTFRGKTIEDPYINAYRFAVSTGARPGEVVGLTYGDAARNVEVRIKRSINVFGEETQGKNSNAIRAFVPQPLAREAIRDQIALLKQQGVKLEYNTLLFNIDDEKRLYRAWKRYCAANDIIPAISLYELRHTFVSLAKYMPEGLVKSIVGHSASMDTFGQYGHELNGDNERAAKELERIFKSILD